MDQAKLRFKLMMIRRNWGLYLLILPAVILLILFAYRPMYGVIIAFKDYRHFTGITGSPWSEPWFKWFERFFNSFQFDTTVRNTLTLSFYSLLAGFPFPILLALGANQMRARRFKRTFLTISYLPHFISTVVMVGLILIWLSPSSGLIAMIYSSFGNQAPNLMGQANAFSSIYVWSEVWQRMGWNSIIYLAALAAVDPTLYEAATVDGASRFQKLIYIDIPMLMPTAAILLILSAGSIMNVGFEKAYLMQNTLNLSASEILSTYVYKIGLINAQHSYSTAINLFNTVINLALLVTVNTVTRKISENSLW
ncbi:MAG: ABC transporter permease subunit [Defluviitaleaceae bacterium]|nr:ABC transporter permease subunit [Defluviitaleaceae bacterium]MCL2836497.1 ABC transporter permease subunit [Defluviitaleaceae bacterium]